MQSREARLLDWLGPVGPAVNGLVGSSRSCPLEALGVWEKSWGGVNNLFFLRELSARDHSDFADIAKIEVTRDKAFLSTLSVPLNACAKTFCDASYAENRTSLSSGKGSS